MSWSCTPARLPSWGHPRDVRRPLHPYSRGLLEAFPSIRGQGALIGIPGSPPDLAACRRGAASSPGALRPCPCSTLAPALFQSWAIPRPVPPLWQRRRGLPRHGGLQALTSGGAGDRPPHRAGSPEACGPGGAAGRRSAGEPLLRSGPLPALPSRRLLLATASSMPSTTSTSPSVTARSWRWSARAGVARARSPACWPWSTSRPAGEIRFEGQLRRRPDAEERTARLPQQSADGVPGPVQFHQPCLSESATASCGR